MCNAASAYKDIEVWYFNNCIQWEFGGVEPNEKLEISAVGIRVDLPMP